MVAIGIRVGVRAKDRLGVMVAVGLRVGVKVNIRG